MRRYQRESESPYPHIGDMVWNVLYEQKITQAELARRLQVTPSSVADYLKQSSLQFGILWNISIALKYDFLGKIMNNYPESFPLNPISKLVIELTAQKQTIADLEKEISIYKTALGIKP